MFSHKYNFIHLCTCYISNILLEISKWLLYKSRIYLRRAWFNILINSAQIFIIYHVKNYFIIKEQLWQKLHSDIIVTCSHLPPVYTVQNASMEMQDFNHIFVQLLQRYELISFYFGISVDYQ